jgi:hypothetical protein
MQKLMNKFSLITTLLLCCVFNINSTAGASNTKICFDFEPTPDCQAIYQWLSEAPWCYAIEVPYYFDGNDIAGLYDDFEKIIVSYDANPKARLSEAKYKKRPVYGPQEVFLKHKKAQNGDLSDTIWLGLLENDSAGTRFPQQLLTDKPDTHAKAKNLIDSHVINAVNFANEHYKSVPLWGVCGYSQTAHIFAQHGLDCVIVERTNDDVEDLHTAVAFARGASKQFDCQWGIDISLWWGPIYGCVQDMDASFHRRNLYISYFNGAGAFRIEGGNLFYNHRKQAFYHLKKVIDEFGNFTKRVSPGSPVVPVAVMLASDHGWMTPPYWKTTRTAWNYARIPYRQGQKGIDGFFGYAFPGNVYAMQAFPFGSYEIDDPPASPFALTCILEYFAPSKEDIYKAEPPIPFGCFKDRNEARNALNSKLKLQAHYRPMSDSRWGDILDVLTEEVSYNVINNYEVVILAGQIKLTEKLETTLISYVENGGRVIISAGVAGPDSRKLTGIKFSPELRAARALKWQNENWLDDSYLFVPVTETNQNVTVLGQTDTKKPAAVCHDLGKGKVYTILAPWYEAGHNDLSLVSKRIFDHVIEPLMPAKVEGLSVEWVTTKAKEQRTILIANHRNNVWEGKVFLKMPDFTASKCSELLSDKKIKIHKCDYGYSADVLIPPYDIKIIRWEK